MVVRYFVGLDLGQSNDCSALAVVERTERTYAVRHLQRFALGTPYPHVVEEVLSLLHSPQLSESLLVVDTTGVGRAVADLLRDRLKGNAVARLPAVSITAGRRIRRNDGGGLNVPKRALIEVLRRLLNQWRLQVAPSLPDAAVLLRELARFQTVITHSGHETFGAQRGTLDDLVLPAALAVWAGENVRASR